MERVFQYLYYIVLCALLGFVIYLTAMLYVSPRQDAQERGFIPCTKELVYELSGCERGKLSCAAKHLWRDMKCNVGVIYAGAKMWAKGEQATPWANYLFEPVLEAKEVQIQYIGNAADDMLNTEKQNLSIQQKQRELEAAKHRQFNIDEDVITVDPENYMPESAITPQDAEENTDIPAGDIDDEAAIDMEAPAESTTVGNNAAPQEKDVLKTLKSKTDDKLQKGNLKDEK